jgi:RNA polymerase sigma-70 factor, ECF subfamily
MEITGIYAQFHQSLLSFIRSKIRSREDAEDILQNVFIKISANINNVSAEEKLRSWIFTVTRNAIIDYYRANASRKNVALDNYLEETIFEETSVDSTQGLDQCMNSMIDLLPEEYKEIIVDSELRGIKQKDLAEKYSMAYPSMRSRVQRGRERLKQLFFNCCHIETDRHGNVLDVRGRTDCDGPCKPCSEDQ